MSSSKDDGGRTVKSNSIWAQKENWFFLVHSFSFGQKKLSLSCQKKRKWKRKCSCRTKLTACGIVRNGKWQQWEWVRLNGKSQISTVWRRRIAETFLWMQRRRSQVDAAGEMVKASAVERKWTLIDGAVVLCQQYTLFVMWIHDVSEAPMTPS